jgi:hypothetical protein
MASRFLQPPFDQKIKNISENTTFLCNVSHGLLFQPILHTYGYHTYIRLWLFNSLLSSALHLYAHEISYHLFWPHTNFNVRKKTVPGKPSLLKTLCGCIWSLSSQTLRWYCEDRHVICCQQILWKWIVTRFKFFSQLASVNWTSWMSTPLFKYLHKSLDPII